MTDTRDFASLLNRKLTPEPWCIDHITFDGTHCEIRGWALPPQGQHSQITFTLNDRPFEKIDFPLHRPDLAKVFWFKPGSETAAFRCQTPASWAQDFKEGYATLKFIHRQSNLPVREEHNWYYPDDRKLPELPDNPRRARVAGNASAEFFRMDGYSTFKKLDLALQKTQSKSIGEFRSILDWGCGCGKTTRYFSLLKNSKLTGADIDLDNLRWCKQHLTFGEFHHLPLHPPTELSSSSFDLLFGISVFSHLKERDQIDWLTELRRIARPDAVLLMSVFGDAAACQSRWGPEMWHEWTSKGIFYSPDNQDLNGFIEDDDYYGNTYLTQDYIRQKWSRFFEVVKIIPAYIGNIQDLVILRKSI